MVIAHPGFGFLFLQVSRLPAELGLVGVVMLDLVLGAAEGGDFPVVVRQPFAALKTFATEFAEFIEVHILSIICFHPAIKV